MTISAGTAIPSPHREGSARNAAWKPVAVPAPGSANDEMCIELLGQVRMLREYVCELLRKNEELRSEVSGAAR